MWFRKNVSRSSLRTISIISLVLAVVGLATSGGEAADRFEPGEAVTTRFVGDTRVLDRLDDGGSARALAAGDFDEDGVADLAVAIETLTGGALVLYRGNVDAIYPNVLEAREKRLANVATDSPFLAPARALAAAVSADTLAAGDFDADGHLDLLTAAIGNNQLYLHAGDGSGAFAPPVLIPLPGELTALTSGEINRRDGLADVIAAVRTSKGPKLLVFEDPAGAFSAPPEIVALRAVATDLALGQLDGIFGVDLAAAADREVYVLRGRDRLRSPGDTAGPEVDRLHLPFKVNSIAVGNFASERPSRVELAVLSERGALHLVEHAMQASGDTKRVLERAGAAGWTPMGPGDAWRLSREIGRLEEAPPAGGRVGLLGARCAGGPTDDLIVVGAGGDSLQLMVPQVGEKARSAGARSSLTAPAPLAADGDAPRGIQKAHRGADDALSMASSVSSLSIAAVPTGSVPRDAVPMRLSSDALSDLVVLIEGRPEPVVMDTKASEIVVVVATTDVVDGITTSISDLLVSPGADGVLGLREAITAANNTTGADAIHFSIPIDTDPGCNAGSGVCTIQPGGDGLPTITQPVTIDGTTQPSFQTTPVIEIDGSLATTSATGLAITAGSSTIRGLVINRFAGNSDIVMWGAGGNVVEGNFLGVDTGGTFNRGTTNSVHVYAVSGNTIGGTTAAARNVISGNTNPAVALNAGASNNLVQGNFIGTDLTGTVALGNDGNDIVTLDSPDNTIGGTTAGSGNLVASNQDPDFASVGLGYPASTGNLVQGNFVGTDVTGTVDLGGASIGVYIADGSNNTIGGTTPAAANLISGGESSGVGIATGSGNLVRGNLIGTQIDGVTPLSNNSHGVLIYAGAENNVVGGRTGGAGNTIAHNEASGVDLRGDAGAGNTVVGNSILGNAELGINFCADFDVDTLVCNDPTAVNPNDADDPDTGANNLQNFPVLTAVHSGRAVDGTLDSIASSDFALDFYASAACDPSGYGEGEIFLDSETVTTNIDGDVAFSIALASAAPAGWFITATATDAAGSTSEVSQCFDVPFDPIFADGFESGDTTAWSSAQGG